MDLVRHFENCKKEIKNNIFFVLDLCTTGFFGTSYSFLCPPLGKPQKSNKAMNPPPEFETKNKRIETNGGKRT